MRVTAPLTKTPMMSRRPVKISSAIIGSGSAMLSTTWLDDQRVRRIDAERDDDEGRQHGHQPAHPDRDAEADEALHDHLPGHGADRRMTRCPRR